MLHTKRHSDTRGRRHGIEWVAVRCEGTLQSSRIELNTAKIGDPEPPRPTQLWHQSKWIDAQLIDRASLRVGDAIAAPAMVVSDQSTLVVEPGWKAIVLDDGTIELTPDSAVA